MMIRKKKEGFKLIPPFGAYVYPEHIVSIYDNEQAEPDYLLTYGANGLLPRGDIVVIAGREKSGKSTFAKVLAAACLSGQAHGFAAKGGEPLKVYWADTEQAMGNVMANMRSVQRMADMTDADMHQRLMVARYRGADRQEIMDNVEDDVAWFEPDLVLLDGFAELVLTMNDAESCKDATEYLMRLSEQNRCCVVTIMHLNRTGNRDEASIDDIQGHAGSYLLKKMAAAFVVDRPKGGGASKILQAKSRNDDFPVLSMLIEGTGADKAVTIGKLSESAIDNERKKLRELYERAIGHCNAMHDGKCTAKNLDESVKTLQGVSLKTASRQRRDALKLGVIGVDDKGREKLHYLMAAPVEGLSALDIDEPLDG